MGSDYKLTIGICCHADTPFFNEAINSFINSGVDWPKTEMLICDDGSPAGGDGDKARALARRADLPFDVRVIRHDNHWKQAASKQHIRDTALGEYQLFFDSDDIFIPFNVKEDIKFLDEHTDYCGTYGKKLLFDAERGFMGQIQGGDYSAFEMLITPPMNLAGMIVRTEDLRNTWGFKLPDGTELDCGDDICMWLGCALKKPFKYVNSFRCLYRKHSQQITHNAQQEYIKNYQRFRLESKKFSNDLYTSINSGEKFSISASRKDEIMILLGALAASSTEEDMFRKYVNMAAKVDPNDYGVQETFINRLITYEKYDEAIIEAFKMLAKHPNCAYVGVIATRSVMQCLAKKGINDSDVLALYNKLGEQHFYLSDSENKLIKQAVDNAKHYTVK